MPKRAKGMLPLAGSGDDGSTGLLGGGRVRKDDLRIEAYGSVDESSSAIGLGKALSSNERVRALCEEMQRGLYRLGAELATAPAQRGRFARTEQDDVERLELAMRELEAEAPMPEGFVLPGATPASAALDVARTVIRRAERRVVALIERGDVDNAEVGRYLNRMSLLVFVLARYEEHAGGVHAKLAKAAKPASAPKPATRRTFAAEEGGT